MVRIEKQGPVTTVVLHRPEARNAVDRETADALSAAGAGDRRHGLRALESAAEGVQRFAQGAGRHGKF
jgi:enoyl-CoA hydratase/carnithine racemase